MRKKLIALALSGSLVAAGFSTGVAAAVVDTQRAVSMDAREQRVAAAQATLAREDVRAAMIELGVDPAEARLRVAALSDAELAQLEGRLQQLPVPSDYGQSAVFLASDDARMITGIDLRVDAGAVARYWAWDPTMAMRT